MDPGSIVPQTFVLIAGKRTPDSDAYREAAERAERAEASRSASAAT
eukprot:CAMPEP_0170146388 /NCGR_PEP_ID=MMETSP0033_2-20121228/29961_1 /TAXON_ID=195969 /ORGANISM="Dolichomastix tenuilepis, Strain CCMP3274" /LENGTH=45 /DNA_ID= /DNA_START= /DNA_END= /DNA_ORIENTATION=